LPGSGLHVEEGLRQRNRRVATGGSAKPNRFPEHRVLGEALLLDDKLEEGVRELRLAVALNPDSDAAHHALGTALFQQQQLPAAEKEFREALRLNASPDNHYSLAACLMTMDRYEEALAELETAARLDPSASSTAPAATNS